MSINHFHWISQRSLSEQFWVRLYFGVWFILGLLLYQGYGLSWDEVTEHTTGVINLNYLLQFFPTNLSNTDPVLSTWNHIPLAQYPDRVFGSIFPLISVGLERLFNIGDGINERAIYQFRHLLNFLFCFLGLLSLYQLSARRFQSWKVGLLTATLFLLSPRFFAETFYNSKDLIFLSAFVIASNQIIAFLLKPSFRLAFLSAITTALAIDIRITGIILIPVTALTLLVQLQRTRECWKQSFGMITLYLTSLAITIIVLWPWLWAAPVDRFFEAFQAFSRWVRNDLNLLYLGQNIRSTTLPWHYAPIWILFTTPLVQLICFLFGAISIVWESIRPPRWLWNSPNQMQDWIFLALLICPIAAVIYLHSVMYDGWRHVYFIYPFFLLIATKGALQGWQLMSTSHNLRSLRIGLLALCALYLIWTTQWMVRSHPLQNTYFNELLGNNWKSQFDVDYWGLSNRQALEFIAKHDSSSLIKVTAGSNLALDGSVRMLKPEDRARIVDIDWMGDANYIITNYRNNTIDYALGDSQFVIVHEIKAGPEIIATVYKRKIPGTTTPRIALNQRIDFSSNGLGQHFLVGIGGTFQLGWGWGYPEAWGVWSDGDRAKLTLPLPTERPSTISLEVIPFLDRQHPRQDFEIKINNKGAGSFSLDDPTAKIITIPLQNYTHFQEPLKIEFVLKNPISPNQLGMGSDTRKLGIGLLSVSFE